MFAFQKYYNTEKRNQPQKKLKVTTQYKKLFEMFPVEKQNVKLNKFSNLDVLKEKGNFGIDTHIHTSTRKYTSTQTIAGLEGQTSAWVVTMRGSIGYTCG